MLEMFLGEQQLGAASWSRHRPRLAVSPAFSLYAKLG